jgi:hypothetical protein
MRVGSPTLVVRTSIALFLTEPGLAAFLVNTLFELIKSFRYTLLPLYLRED